MDWRTLVVIALGLGCIVASQFLPAVAAYLLPAGTGLLGWAMPQAKKKAE